MPSRYKKTPQHQREEARLLAKKSMRGGGRLLAPLQSQLAAQHAGAQFGRQLEFEKLASYKKAGDVRAKWADKIYGLKARQLKKEKGMLGLQTWLGLGGAGVSYLIGEHQRKLMAQERQETQDFRNALLADQEGYRTYNKAYEMGLIGGLS
jgi:hypothetical protein